ncbi:MAG: hypothetical protein A4E53_01808 [Pelotomaculum sp. PtaB.Bin104]|nr:MAG: hypothetical protein A4E53_01808 [Pelotomaculum sp. PtaB.Bin104]
MFDFNEICVGNVTVLMANQLVLTGRISRHPVKVDDEDFFVLTLTAPLLIEPGNKGPAPELPFYVVGDTVKINEDNVISIGPANITNGGV